MLGFHLDGANRAEVRLAEQTLDTIRVARPRGRSKRRPEKLVADRGYDSSAFRRVLRGRGIRMCIPPKRRPKNGKAKRGRPVVARKDEYRLRFTVERSVAWLGNFRRLLIRWERLFSVYRSGFAFAVMLLCVALCCFVCAERLPWRARSRWGKSREGGVRGGARGTIGSTKMEHERLRAAPAS
ncbi:MAG TPA: transposase [Chloroflexota bacterium]